jgi:flagellar biogenesis protein FliO
MWSLLFQGWVVVLASIEVLPEPTPELPPLKELSAKPPQPEPGAELLPSEPAPELLLPEPDTQLPPFEASAEFLSLEPSAELSSLEPGLGWMLLQTLLVLGGVVLLAYVLLSLGGKYFLKLRDGGGRRVISVVERVSVDARKSLLLVKVAKDYFLLSSGERVLTVLSKLNTEDVEQALSNNKSPGEPGLFLQKLLERKTTKKPSDEGEP